MLCNSEEWGADVLFNLYLCSVINGTLQPIGALSREFSCLVLKTSARIFKIFLDLVPLHWPELIMGKRRQVSISYTNHYGFTGMSMWPLNRFGVLLGRRGDGLVPNQ